MTRWANAAALLVLLVPLPAETAPTRRYLMGLPWEDAIIQGIETQNRAQRRRKPVDALVSQHTRRARRSQTVENLYLLARAYGLRFSEAREQAAKTHSAAERARLEAQAERDLASAQSTYRDALRLDARCYFAYHDLGVLELRRKRRSKRAAYDQFIRALQINGRYVDAIRKLILLYLEGDQHQYAVEQLRRLLRLEPKDDIARTQLVVGLSKIALYDEALRELEVLLTLHPRKPAYLDLKAQLFVKQQRFDEALLLYRDLARANPNVPTAFVGMLRSLKALSELDPEATPRFEEYLFAFRGLLRLERDPNTRARLEKDIAMMEAAQHRPPPSTRDPSQPFTTDEVLSILSTATSEEDRLRAIAYFFSREEPITPRVVKAVAVHLSPTREPAAVVRAAAVRALEFAGGTATVGMIRLALTDADVRVRTAVVDALAAIATRDASVRPPLLIVLGAATEDPDAGVAAAARQAILRLSETRLDVKSDAASAAHEVAFKAWWRGDTGQDLIATGLERYGDVPDRFPEDILLAYLDHPSILVGRAAYKALGRVQAPPGSTRANWLAARPRFADDAWTQGSWDTTRSTLRSWTRGRPR